MPFLEHQFAWMIGAEIFFRRDEEVDISPSSNRSNMSDRGSVISIWMPGACACNDRNAGPSRTVVI